MFSVLTMMRRGCCEAGANECRRQTVSGFWEPLRIERMVTQYPLNPFRETCRQQSAVMDQRVEETLLVVYAAIRQPPGQYTRPPESAFRSAPLPAA
jgi:hypothetical protein